MRQAPTEFSARRRNPTERRDQLVAAARRVFEKKGFARTSVSDIVKAAGVAQGTFYLYFKEKNDISKHCIEINRIENQGDDITHVAVAGLFKKYDAVDIIKLKEIYEYLEEATDKCEDAADVIKDIFMKNS